jgi:acetylornithine deacetylase/succinyl-diaminopimelate desuccinylase-like protein
VFGPGSIHQAHSPDEYLDIGQLPACVAVVAGAVADYLKPE